MHANVLVTATGGIVAQGIVKSLRLANSSSGPVRYRIVGVDMSPFSAGLYRCDEGLIVPPVSSVDYIDAIITACKKNEIDGLFVGSDDELLCLAEAKKRIERECDTKVIVGDHKALAIARDKWETYQFCQDNGIPCPASSLPDDYELFLAEYGYPVVVKPTAGYGSRDIFFAKNREEVSHAITTIRAAHWKPILQRYVPGMEFTSGVTLNKNGKTILASITIQKTIKHGQTYKALIDDFSIFRKSAESTAVKLGSGGPVNIQTMVDTDQTPILIEINPRFSASCPMRAVAGVNEPDIVFRNVVLGEDLKVERYEPLVCFRYWNEVYVPKASLDQVSVNGQTLFKENKSFIPQYF